MNYAVKCDSTQPNSFLPSFILRQFSSKHNQIAVEIKMKWNEWGCGSPLCTYRLDWARRTSWGWWDEWDDTALQPQDSKFETWRSETEHATSRSQRLPTILNLYEWAEKKQSWCVVINVLMTYTLRRGPNWRKKTVRRRWANSKPALGQEQLASDGSYWFKWSLGFSSSNAFRETALLSIG